MRFVRGKTTQSSEDEAGDAAPNRRTAAPTSVALKDLIQRHRRVVTLIVYGAANLQPRLTAAALVFVYARFLALGEYGRYGILVALTSLLCITADLGMPMAILRGYCDHTTDGKAASAYVRSLIRGSWLLSLISTPVLAGLVYLCWRHIGAGASVAIDVLCLTAISYFDRSSEILAAVCRAMEKPGLYALGRYVQGAVTITAGIVFVVIFHGGALGAMAGMAVGRAATAWSYRLALTSSLGPACAKTNWADMRACLSYGLPFVPQRVLVWLREPALRPILAMLVTMPAVGLFTLAASVASIPMIFSSTLNLALTPLYFRQRNSDKPGFRPKIARLTAILNGLSFPLWAIAILFCGEIIHVLATDRFVPATAPCAVLFCATFIRSQNAVVLREIEWMRDTWILPIIAAAGTAVSLALTYVLTPGFGIVAAAAAVLCSDVVLVCGAYIAVRRKEHSDYPLATTLVLLAILLVLAVWVGSGQPLPDGIPAGPLRLLFAAVICAASYRIWFRPHRDFLRGLMSR
jgi:O-antigen/teichoic acid export membrane protein